MFEGFWILGFTVVRFARIWASMCLGFGIFGFRVSGRGMGAF